MVRYRIKDGEISARDCEIVSLQVHSGRGRGTGTALVKQAENYLRQVEKCRRAHVYTTGSSARFWNKMGYTSDFWSPNNMTKAL